MKTAWKEFYEKAALLGHNIEALEQGAEEVRYFTFASLEEGSRLLSVATREQRKLRQETFFNPAIALRQRLGQGKHDRGEAILFADGAFADGDEQGVNNHLPARIKAVSVLEKTVKAGAIWDISVRGVVWGIDDLEELYTTVNVGRLILEPGAKVIVQGNVCSLLCQELIIQDTEETPGGYHIGILPTPFSVDLKNGPMNGINGIAGTDGTDGRDGLPVQVTSSILGYRLVSEFIPDELNGKDASGGSDGTAGKDGRNGGMSKIAELTIRNLQGQLTVLARAGQGGNGGNGGDGGNAGKGGDGAKGYKLMQGMVTPGAGGDGGNGGNGGNGGHAGHGGLSSNIYVNVPDTALQQVHCIALPSKGGTAGKGGLAGTGGTGGNRGTGPSVARDGKPGIDGFSGKNGKEGRSRSAPYMFLNEENQTSVPENDTTTAFAESRI